MDDPHLGFVGGRIDITFAGKKPTAIEAYDALMYLRQQAYVEKASFGATANLLTTVSVIAAAGNFDEAFLSGGDAEWGSRVSALGYRGAYAPEARVFHPARRTVPEIVRKTRRIVGGEAVLARRLDASLLHIAREELWRATGQYLTIIRGAGTLGPFLIMAVAGLTGLLRLVRIDEWIKVSLGKAAER